MVIKQKNNGKWEYCVYLGLDERGKKKYKRKSGFTTKKACTKEAKEVQNNENIRPSYKTFEEICKLYIDDCKLRMLRESTVITYISNIKFLSRNFIQFNQNIKKIKPEDIQRFIIHCCNTTRKSFTRYIISLLKAIFKFAEKHNYINNDVFHDIKLPPIYKGDKLIWSKSDLERYLPLLKK